MQRVGFRDSRPTEAAPKGIRVRHARRAATAVVAVLVAGTCLAAPVLAAAASPVATATPPTTLYAWSGGMAPFESLNGARLLADGTIQILEVPPADRGSGTVRVRGTVTPTPEQLAAIRARAAALPVAAARAASRGPDGSYALAVAVVNGHDRAILSVNGLDPRLGELLAAINAALPDARHLQAERPAPGVQRAHAPECADKPATEISRTKTLKQAANEKLVKLKPKGGFAGDTVAVDLTGKPTSGPVTMTIHIELVDAHPFEALTLTAFAALASKRIGTRRASNGTKLTVAFDLRTRLPGDPATPCFHQIRIVDTPGYRSNLDGYGAPNSKDGAATGAWGSQDPDWGTGYLLAHEGLHLAGLRDQYTDIFRVPGKADVVVPETVDSADAAMLGAWLRSVGRDPAAGVIGSRPRPGHANDIMATAKKGSRLLTSDVNAFVAQAGVHLHADPGDLLANKDPDQQNLGVGAPLDMFAPRRGKAHRDGLWAYCLDLARHKPEAGGGLDVLGPAASLPGANMAQLQAVLEVVGRHHAELASNPYRAQEAIWVVTDAADGLVTDPQSLLAEAGVAGPIVGTSHFVRPQRRQPRHGRREHHRSDPRPDGRARGASGARAPHRPGPAADHRGPRRSHQPRPPRAVDRRHRGPPARGGPEARRRPHPDRGPVSRADRRAGRLLPGPPVPTARRGDLPTARHRRTVADRSAAHGPLSWTVRPGGAAVRGALAPRDAKDPGTAPPGRAFSA